MRFKPGWRWAAVIGSSEQIGCAKPRSAALAGLLVLQNLTSPSLLASPYPGKQDELAKCKRSITKRLPEAPHEVLLVLDGTTGLNMLNQASREGSRVPGCYDAWLHGHTAAA